MHSVNSILLYQNVYIVQYTVTPAQIYTHFLTDTVIKNICINLTKHEASLKKSTYKTFRSCYAVAYSSILQLLEKFQ